MFTYLDDLFSASEYHPRSVSLSGVALLIRDGGLRSGPCIQLDLSGASRNTKQFNSHVEKI